eukprot:1844715-Amphidinium_carterae.2
MEPSWPAQQMVFFDPTRPHEVRSSDECTSIIAYTTTRQVHVVHAIELRSLAFPLEAAYDDMSANSTATQTHDDMDESVAEPGVVCMTSQWDISLNCHAIAPAPLVVISPTLPFEPSMDPDLLQPTICDCHPREEMKIPLSEEQELELEAGAVDSAELSRLSQRVRDLQLGYSMKTVRALITLDAKVRRVLRDDGRNKSRVESALEHMSATSDAGASSTWQQQDGASRETSNAGWSEVRRRRKKSTERKEVDQEPEKITLCPSAWSIPTRKAEELKLDTSAAYQIQDMQKLQEMALKAIHADCAIMAIAPFKADAGYAPPVQQALPFDVERTKAHINVWIHQLATECVYPAAAAPVIALEIDGVSRSRRGGM